MTHPLIALTLTFGLSLGLAACGPLGIGRKAPQTPASGAEGGDLATEFAPAVTVTPLGAAGQNPEALDQTSPAEKSAALAAPAPGGERALGRQVVALGSPAEPGLWLQTALVTAPAQGRVVGPSGQSLALELRPGSGAALLSLSAYQALGLPLTALPELAVFGP